MKYVAILYNSVIVAKSKNHDDCIYDNEIELTENQYNNVPIPCQLINGEFVPCDFPEVELKTTVPTIGLTEIKSYTGDNTSGSSYPCSLTFSFAPRVILYLGYYYHHNGDGGYVLDTEGSNSTKNMYNVMLCDFLTTEYTKRMGFVNGDASKESVYAKKSEDGKTVYWYNTDSTVNAAQHQLNNLGTYYFLGIG